MSEFTDTAQNLEILAEECSEVIQICARVIQVKSKITRFGIDDYHPDRNTSNRDELHKELGGLLEMVDILIDSGVLNEKKLQQCMMDKKKKLEKWYKF